MSYSTDLSDRQWALIKPLLPEAKFGGRPRKIIYSTRCRSDRVPSEERLFVRNLPSDFPPWQTVYWNFKNWRRDGTLKNIHRALVKKVRRKARKTLYPTIAILDSQSVKTGKMAQTDKGYDGGKHVKGRKRHIAVDTFLPATSFA